MNAETPSAVKISASLKVSKKHRNSIVPAVVKFTAVLMSCGGSVFSFISCFDIPSAAAVKAAVIISAVISCMIFTMAFNMKQDLRRKASLGVSAVFLISVRIFRNDICAGLANILNIYFARIRKEFRKEPFIMIAEPESAVRHITVCFCFITALICISAAYCVSKEWFTIGLCISPLIMPISVLMFGLEPNYIAFAAVVAGCAASIAYEIASSEKENSLKCRYAASYSAVFAAVSSIVCFFAVTALVKLSDYKRSEQIDSIYNNVTGYIERGEIQNVLDEVATLVVGDNRHTGAIDHGRLGEIGEIYFDGKTVLEVTIPKPTDTVYLRGFVGSVYTGNSWKPLPSSKQKELDKIVSGFGTEGLSPMLMDSYSLKNSGVSLPKYSFSIQNISAGKDYLYMPYDLVPESVSRYTDETGSGFAGGERSYLGQYYDPSGYYGYKGIFRLRWNISQAMLADEAAYRRFVYENYLDLPDEHERLDAIFGDDYYEYITGEEILTGKSTLDEMTVFSRKLYFIKSWLKNNCEYSLNAGKLPARRDFVDRFLETRRGSCSHFASTAVMMCRNAGIPARYVEGYIIKPSSDFSASTAVGETETIKITDARAHAWAEIYIDGFGWYPMEFTSGYGNVRTALPTETIPTETEEETETETETEEVTTTVSAGEQSPNVQTTLPAAQENTNAQPEETSAEQQTSSPAESTMPEQTDNDTSPPTVGFGIFGIKGKVKTDIYYDLTGVFFAVLVIAAIPSAFIVRRKLCLHIYRKKCSSGKKNAALAAYKKFCRIVRIMKLPEQGGTEDLEYAKMLSERSPLLADGTAETIIGTALKASFGGAHLTSDDAKEAVLTVNSFAKRYFASLTKWEKFKAKYIHCII